MNSGQKRLYLRMMVGFALLAMIAGGPMIYIGAEDVLSKNYNAGVKMIALGGGITFAFMSVGRLSALLFVGESPFDSKGDT